ncbi:Tn7 transposase TnsA N-terminal domain-containing protein [Shewanella sp. 202IG2-18]|uniref:TnsA endonuclease N-terminal domain-containing protein n=1 Tax=Parashewanella hymeniacidonis TaxID=2807618 RepID=UPI00196095B6|nr:TnsA endonuclease N-terminal domain-containing protein [Parashewanella hymeniacidonis]MBM7070681.1 Tn7 transposase TnsA N-terminal domain-containing protein [Parashewanella hymeniacidonis]
MSKSINVFPADKSLDQISYQESSLEADLCYHLEFDKNVLSYQPQPPKIFFRYKNELHEYTADFLVNYRDGTIRYIEVKFNKDIERIDDFDERNAAIEMTLESKGFEFQVLTEDEIRRKPLYENLLLLWAAKNINLDSEFILRVIKTLDRYGSITISDLLTADGSDLEFEQVYRLIFDGKLLAPINKELLSKQTLVKHSGESYECYL